MGTYKKWDNEGNVEEDDEEIKEQQWKKEGFS